VLIAGLVAMLAVRVPLRGPAVAEPAAEPS
jgi:UMF1 family MFS transporter